MDYINSNCLNTMIYKAKYNLTVPLKDGSSKNFVAGSYYKVEDITEEVDQSNFTIMTEGEAKVDRVKTQGINASANIVRKETPKGDLE